MRNIAFFKVLGLTLAMTVGAAGVATDALARGHGGGGHAGHAGYGHVAHGGHYGGDHAAHNGYGHQRMASHFGYGRLPLYGGLGYGPVFDDDFAYDYGSDYDSACWQTEQVQHRGHLRWRRVNVCG